MASESRSAPFAPAATGEQGVAVEAGLPPGTLPGAGPSHRIRLTVVFSIFPTSLFPVSGFVARAYAAVASTGKGVGRLRAAQPCPAARDVADTGACPRMEAFPA